VRSTTAFTVSATRRRLVEAVEMPVSDSDLADMTYRAALQWAADDTGRLVPERLQRMARAKGYREGWAWHLAGRNWEHVWQDTLRWRAQQEASNG
jgi:hypothetical protein